MLPLRDFTFRDLRKELNPEEQDQQDPLPKAKTETGTRKESASLIKGTVKAMDPAVLALAMVKVGRWPF